MKIVYAVRDNKVGSYFDPMFFPHVAACVRMLTEVVQDNKSTLSKHPQDFELYELGTYDDSRGDLDVLPNPKFIMNITDLVQKAGL